MILVPIGRFPGDVLEELAYRAGVRLAPLCIDPKPAWNSERGQYSSARLIEELKSNFEEPVVGAADVDLFLPVLTFVFGEAEMPGRAAVFSIHRLREEFYGLPQNRHVLIDRAYREFRHEWGHLSGLAHCRDSGCVMASSHSVELVDSKTGEFCRRCSTVFESVFPLRPHQQNGWGVGG